MHTGINRLQRQSFVQWLPHLLIVAITAAYVLRYYYIFPMLDYLEAVRFFEKSRAGELRWDEVNFLYGGHWYLISTNWQILLSKLTQWDMFYEAVSVLVIMVFTMALWLACAMRGDVRGKSGRLYGASLLAGTFVIFSLDQATNMLWTHQMSHFIHNAGIMLAVWAVAAERFRALHLVAAIFGGLLAIYSFSAGFALLPTVFLALLLRPGIAKDTRVLYLATWCFFSAFCILNFMASYKAHILPDYDTGMHFELTLSFLYNLILFGIYFVGAPVCRIADWLMPVAGVGGFVIAALLLRKAIVEKRREPAWIAGAALVLFSLGAAAITFIGRYTLGYEQANNPRYFTLANLFWLGLLILFMQAGLGSAFFTARQRKIAACILCLLCALKLVNSVHFAKKQARISGEYNAAARLVGEQGPQASDETLLELFWDAPRARRYVTTMQRLELNVFAERD